MIHAHVTLGKTIATYVALLVFTFLSFGASKLGLSGPMELGVALTISVLKTLLVLFIFMHLVEQRFANRLIVIVTFLFIVLLVSLTAADPLTRKTYPRTPDPSARPPQ
jgi:cytochrome c oxidase subunit IV